MTNTDQIQSLKAEVYATLKAEGFTQKAGEYGGELNRIAPDGVREFARVCWNPEGTKAWAAVKRDVQITGNDILNRVPTLSDRYEVSM